MAQLAKCVDARQLTRLDDLAQREDVSANFLVQILNDLRRAGLVESRRGMSGGYLLAQPPSSITLRRIIEAVDPAVLQPSVAEAGDSGAGVARVWKQVAANLAAALDSITLADMAENPSAPMFHI
jgi:Rrf2 family protein